MEDQDYWRTFLIVTIKIFFLNLFSNNFGKHSHKILICDKNIFQVAELESNYIIDTPDKNQFENYNFYNWFSFKLNISPM